MADSAMLASSEWMTIANDFGGSLSESPYLFAAKFASVWHRGVLCCHRWRAAGIAFHLLPIRLRVVIAHLSPQRPYVGKSLRLRDLRMRHPLCHDVAILGSASPLFRFRRKKS